MAAAQVEWEPVNQVSARCKEQKDGTYRVICGATRRKGELCPIYLGTAIRETHRVMYELKESLGGRKVWVLNPTHTTGGQNDDTGLRGVVPDAVCDD